MGRRLSSVRTFSYCCGANEIEIGGYAGLGVVLCSESLLYVAESILLTIGNRAVAVATDNTKSRAIHKKLSKIVEPIRCGTNDNYRTTIYLWVFTKIGLKKFIKDEKAKLKAQEKANKLSASNKK